MTGSALVLLVSQDDYLSDAIVHALRNDGLSVERAESWRAAQPVLGDLRPHLVVLAAESEGLSRKRWIARRVSTSTVSRQSPRRLPMRISLALVLAVAIAVAVVRAVAVASVHVVVVPVGAGRVSIVVPAVVVRDVAAAGAVGAAAVAIGIAAAIEVPAIGA